MTGNPSRKDMELSVMAKYERRDAYEAILLGLYELNPLIHQAEQRAKHWLESWRVLKVSDKYSSAVAIAAFRARAGRRAAADAVAVDAAENTASSGVNNTAESQQNGDAPSPASRKQQRPAAYCERPMGTQSTLAKNAMDAAIRKDLGVSTETMTVFARSMNDRAVTTTLSASAIRGVPSFREFLARRTEEMIAAYNVSAAGSAASAATALPGDCGSTDRT